MTRRQTLGVAGAVGLAGCQRVDPMSFAAEATESESRTQQGQTVRAYVASYHWGYVILDESGQELDQVVLSPGDELRLTLVNVEAVDAVASLPQSVRTALPNEDERKRRNEDAIPIPDGVSMDALHEVAESLYPDHGLAIVPTWAAGETGSGDGPRGPAGTGGSGGGSRGPNGPGGGWGGHHGPHDGHGPTGGGESGHHGGPSGSGWGPRSPGTPGMLPDRSGGYGRGWTLAPPTYLWHHATVPAELGFVADTTGAYGFACPVYCGYGHPYMLEAERIVIEDV